MVGAFAVGKTALIERYVHSIFSDRYLSTVGVKISKRECRIDDATLTLMLWDMEGKGEYCEINAGYLRGAMGFFLVADGTRRETLDAALQLRRFALDIVGSVPHFLLLNKADIEPKWEIKDEDILRAEAQGVRILRTSAKEGYGVDEAFELLARDILLLHTESSDPSNNGEKY
jgi:small GTP-binding protein